MLFKDRTSFVSLVLLLLLGFLPVFSVLAQSPGFVNFTSAEGESFKIKYEDERTNTIGSSTIVFEGNGAQPLFKVFQRESLDGLATIFAAIEGSKGLANNYLKGGLGVYALCNISGTDCTPYEVLTATVADVTAGDGIDVSVSSNNATVSWDHTATQVLTMGANKIVHTDDSNDYGLALSSDGSLTVDADVTAGGTITASSDVRLKKNIQPLGSSLENIKQLEGVTYEWIDSHRGEGLQIGVIAQDVEQVYPELVKDGDDGYKSVNYQALVVPLIESVKELSARVEALEAELQALKN